MARTTVRANSVLRIAYDRPVDVLHIVQGDLTEYEGDGRPGGLELDYSVEDSSAVGAKVIGFERNGWRAKIDTLAGLVADHLSVDKQAVKSAIKRAVT